MSNIYRYFNEHKFESYVIAFLLMTIPPLLMYYAAQDGNISLIFVLLGFIVLGNLLVLMIR